MGRCLILGKEVILRQVFIHGTRLELLQPLVMDVDSMEEILMGVMGKMLHMGAVVEVVRMEWDVEDMLGVSQHWNIMMMDYLAHHMRQNGKGGATRSLLELWSKAQGRICLQIVQSP